MRRGTLRWRAGGSSLVKRTGMWNWKRECSPTGDEPVGPLPVCSRESRRPPKPPDRVRLLAPVLLPTTRAWLRGLAVDAAIRPNAEGAGIGTFGHPGERDPVIDHEEERDIGNRLYRLDGHIGGAGEASRCKSGKRQRRCCNQPGWTSRTREPRGCRPGRGRGGA